MLLAHDPSMAKPKTRNERYGKISERQERKDKTRQDKTRQNERNAGQGKRKTSK
jgi:hypothetical protein